MNSLSVPFPVNELSICPVSVTRSEYELSVYPASVTEMSTNSASVNTTSSELEIVRITVNRNQFKG